MIVVGAYFVSKDWILWKWLWVTMVLFADWNAIEDLVNILEQKYLENHIRQLTDKRAAFLLLCCKETRTMEVAPIQAAHLRTTMSNNT